MKSALVLACLLLAGSVLPGQLRAAPTTLTVTGLGTITFETPPLNKIGEANAADHYSYVASSARLGLSIVVEPPKCDGGQTNVAAANCFNAKLPQVPGIVRQSISTECLATYCDVSYLVIVPIKGQVARQLNMDVLFAFHGRWANAHVTVINPTAQDLQVLDAFEKSISYK
jgi:hypothetical protein